VAGVAAQDHRQRHGTGHPWHRDDEEPFVAGRLEIDARYRIKDACRLALILLFVGAPKLLQEYVMHYRESQTWHFILQPR
jgi:hypothetical protein